MNKVLISITSVCRAPQSIHYQQPNESIYGGLFAFWCFSCVFPETPGYCPYYGISVSVNWLIRESKQYVATQDELMMFKHFTALYSHLVAKYIYHSMCQPDALTECGLFSSPRGGAIHNPSETLLLTQYHFSY